MEDIKLVACFAVRNQCKSLTCFFTPLYVSCSYFKWSIILAILLTHGNQYRTETKTKFSSCYFRVGLVPNSDFRNRIY